MVTLTKNGLERNIAVEDMLYQDMLWLIKQAPLPVKKFLKIAEQMELPNELWSLFWKEL